MASEETAVGQEQDIQLTEVTAVAEPEEATESKADGEASVDNGKENDTRPSDIEALKAGMRLKGKVQNIVDFGAFIDIGVGRDGLAHISALKRAGIDKTIKVGDTVNVQIRRIDLESNRISLTVPGAGKGRKKSLRDLEIGSLVTGQVMRLVNFGAFVDIGAQTDGLLHISQLNSGYVSHPSEVVKVGDEVRVRILEVDSEKRRVSLSMKNVGPSAELQTLQEDDPDAGSNMPTTFQIAWENALTEQRRRQRRR